MAINEAKDVQCTTKSPEDKRSRNSTLKLNESVITMFAIC